MMQGTADEVFISLFKEAFAKCFVAELNTALSETECKHFSNRILEETGACNWCKEPEKLFCLRAQY